MYSWMVVKSIAKPHLTYLPQILYSMYEQANLYIFRLCFLVYHVSSAIQEITPLLSSPARLLFYVPCQFSAELTELPHGFFASQVFFLPVQKAFPLTACFPLELGADQDLYLTNNLSRVRGFWPQEKQHFHQRNK